MVAEKNIFSVEFVWPWKKPRKKSLKKPRQTKQKIILENVLFC